MTVKQIVIIVIFTIFSLNIFALDNKSYTVRELKMDSIINEILLLLEKDEYDILKNSDDDSISIKFIKTYYASTNSARLRKYLHFQDFAYLGTLDSLYVPFCNNKTLSFFWTYGIKYTIAIYKNQIVLFSDNDCVSTEDVIAFPEQDLIMLNGKKKVLISPFGKKHQVLGLNDPIIVDSNFFYSNINYYGDGVDRNQIIDFNCKDWTTEIVGFGISPILSINKEEIVYIVNNLLMPIEGKEDTYYSNDNISAYNLKDKSTRVIFNIPDSLFTSCGIGDSGGESEISQCTYQNKEAFKMTVYNRKDCECENVNFYEYIFNENGVLDIFWYSRKDRDKKKLN